MSERPAPFEHGPSPIEVRRDALLLRIAEAHDALAATDLDPAIAADELAELSQQIQQTSESDAMTVYEGIFDAIERMIDSRKKPE